VPSRVNFLVTRQVTPLLDGPSLSAATDKGGLVGLITPEINRPGLGRPGSGVADDQDKPLQIVPGMGTYGCASVMWPWNR